MNCKLSRFELRNFRYPVRWSWVTSWQDWSEYQNMVLRLSATVPDRDTGEERRVGSTIGFSPEMNCELEHVVFESLRLFAEHEADEAFCVDGQRLLDPHVENHPPRHPLADMPLRGEPDAERHGRAADVRERLRSFFPRVTVKHLLYPTRWWVTAPGPGPVILTLIAEVDDRDTGMCGEALMHRAVPDDITDAGIAHLMLEQLRAFMVHEAAECFYADGVRVFDPHKERMR